MTPWPRTRSPPMLSPRARTAAGAGKPPPIACASRLLRAASRSIGQHAPRSPRGQGETRGGALIVSGKDVCGAVDGDVVDHHAEAIRAAAGFVHRAAEGDAGMRQVDHAADLPGRAVAGVGGVDVGGPIRVLVDSAAARG